MKDYSKFIGFIQKRQTGKSFLLKNGIDNYDKPFILVCKSIEEGKRLTNNPNCKIVTPKTSNNLMGTSIPIIFDQEVILDMLIEYENLKLFKEIHKA